MKKNRKVVIRITESQLAKIVAESTKNQINKSTLLRDVLDDYFEQKLSQNLVDSYRQKKTINNDKAQ